MTVASLIAVRIEQIRVSEPFTMVSLLELGTWPTTSAASFSRR